MSPVWPTMSGLAKLMIPKRKPAPSASSSQAEQKARLAATALICGFWS